MSRSVISCVMGNILEWYEFSLFAYLSPIIAHQFFPSSNKQMALLSTLLVFAAGFIIRPLGSLFWGHWGDKVGRAKTLMLTLFCISLASTLTGLLPTYEAVGALAPSLLVLLRLLQGFCMGGEFAGSMIYLTETASKSRRTLISSMANNGSNIGVMLAVISCALVSRFLGDALIDYGWRILYISSGIIGFFGLWLRSDLTETAIFLNMKDKIKPKYLPIKFVLLNQKAAMLKVFCILFISASGSYTLMGYISTYLYEFIKIPLPQAYHIQTLFIMITLLAVPVFASIADYFGKNIILVFAISGYLLFALPCFMYLKLYNNWLALLPLFIFYSAEQAVTPSLIVEIFPVMGRYTGISLSYNLCMALVGGLSPAINTFFIHTYHNQLFIAYYLMFCATISFITMIVLLAKRKNLVTDELFAGV